MTTNPSARAVKAVGELRQAIQTVKASNNPTPTNLAIVELLEATASYWIAWLPAEPTRLDRAALALARSITGPPEPAAGSLPETAEGTNERKVTP